MSTTDPAKEASSAESYDPLSVDFYARHLAQINERKPVVAQEDICSAQGGLLVPKGTALSRQITDRIVSFRLMRPLESSIQITKEIDGLDLRRHFQQVLAQHPRLAGLFQQQDLSLALQMACNDYQGFPVLRQKLTVLADRLPQVYQKCLETSLLSLMLIRQLGLPEEQTRELMLAGLAHDIGMLHINPNLIMHSGDLEPHDWRQLQAHTIIGQKILAAIPTMPKAVARAVLEHHERCDGTGYPQGKHADQLGRLGQILALCEGAVASYRNRLQPHDKDWRDLIPALQMDTQSHGPDNSAGLILLLRQLDKPPLPKGRPDSPTQPIQLLKEQISVVRQALLLIKPPLMQTVLPDREQNLKLVRLKVLYSHVSTAVRGSGIVEDSYQRWLQHLAQAPYPEGLAEVREVQLMLEELAFHLHRLGRMISLFPAEELAPVQTELAPLLPQLSKIAGRSKSDGTKIQNAHTSSDLDCQL